MFNQTVLLFSGCELNRYTVQNNKHQLANGQTHAEVMLIQGPNILLCGPLQFISIMF